MPLDDGGPEVRTNDKSTVRARSNDQTVIMGVHDSGVFELQKRFKVAIKSTRKRKTLLSRNRA